MPTETISGNVLDGWCLYVIKKKTWALRSSHIYCLYNYHCGDWLVPSKGWELLWLFLPHFEESSLQSECQDKNCYCHDITPDLRSSWQDGPLQHPLLLADVLQLTSLCFSKRDVWHEIKPQHITIFMARGHKFTGSVKSLGCKSVRFWSFVSYINKSLILSLCFNICHLAKWQLAIIGICYH